MSCWLRRAGIAAGLTLFAAFMIFMLGAVMRGLQSEAHGNATIELYGAGAAAVAWSTCSVVVSVRRGEAAVLNGTRRESASTRSRRSGVAAGAGPGVAARGGSPVAGALVLIGLFLVIGWFIVPAVMSFRRYLGPEEKLAAQGVAQWRAQHPDWQP